uniref:Uncharacterized protein MANES_03G107200 n=1 Tax=Rhizophora mucronata TaxID=61149 RepID=A0A2P2IL73_RHIMU
MERGGRGGRRWFQERGSGRGGRGRGVGSADAGGAYHRGRGGGGGRNLNQYHNHHHQQQQYRQQHQYQRQRRFTDTSESGSTRSVRVGPAQIDRGGGRGLGPTDPATPVAGDASLQTALRSEFGAESLADPAGLQLDSLKISERLAFSPQGIENTILPVKRPDKGGFLAIRTASLLVNHFRVRFNSESIIRHYDVDVKPEMLPKNGRKKISKLRLVMIRDKLFIDYPDLFPLSMTAYDGEKNIFSAVDLPTGEFRVEFSEGQDMKKCTYIFSIKLVNEHKFSKLKDYLTGSLFSIPRDVLQGMDVVMKENPARNMISVGRRFHNIVADEADDLGFGITASRGFQHGLKLTFQGPALCLDYSILAFHKRLPVIDFLREHFPNFDTHYIKMHRKDIQNALKGLKVTVTHRITKQRYTIAGLTKEDARQLSFPVEDSNGKAPPKLVKVTDYFKEKYFKHVVYQDIPCLDLGTANKRNYVPMEFCVLLEGQIFPKEHLDKNAARMLKDMSLAPPDVRRNTICDMVRSRDGPCGSNVIQNFGLEVDLTMTSVVGRVLGPPELKLGGSNGRAMKIVVDKEKCQWNLVGKGVVEGKPIDQWVILDFSSKEVKEHYKLNCKQFVSKLIVRCKNLGIPMDQPLFTEDSDMSKLSKADVLQELLEHLDDQAFKICKGKLQLIICVMSRKHPGYKYLKWISETRVGVVTQCCLSTLANRGNDQYLANLALKINAKLGGSNVELMDQVPCFRDEDHVIFMGADVNHPGAGNKTSPSIAAVVATVNWPAANRYAARFHHQYRGVEKILNFKDMCLDLIRTYACFNNVRPKRIVIFRDGVGEGQFDMVLNEELMDLKEAFQLTSYTPTITLIVAQKRHHTRLFPEARSDGGSTGNVFPGTVVDTQIVHPFEFDFYLCSHYGSIGTSKPTHYQVLWDEYGFTSDQLEKLIYDMCFTFARCTKPVSLVPPVYYADLAAYRGRLYHEAVIESRQPLTSAASSSSSLMSSTVSSAAALDDKFFKLHADLENFMFFV